jgi:transposase
VGSAARQKEVAMEVLYGRCCGLDVHKETVAACVLIRDTGRVQEKRIFGTTTEALLELAGWLTSHSVTHVAMESTSVYWKPVWNNLEGLVDITLVNPQHFKSVPARKTDLKDGEWIGDLLQHGLLRKSFVPPRPIRDLRDLTRCRAMLAREKARLSSRIQKVLEDANIKLASVASDVLGASGRDMLNAIARGRVRCGCTVGTCAQAAASENSGIADGLERIHHRSPSSSASTVARNACSCRTQDCRIRAEDR